ncbi:D-alanyl-D-alanine carboxypeptidase family protein [Clostridium sp. L74]|uniref:D-alanyl-D-alanine carboxypeptidase family protein n=1 Tax=Clostridium sp. L74 TaxID=1560217 RepID=UPI0006ABBA03|nr:D-alanyl-D-alanine carboxypeptidase family protein [Clostridium sp. L74]KOR24265.1 D-alanyl-D-alanine carboxypeptidase [Clostridium sp. L74]
MKPIFYKILCCILLLPLLISNIVFAKDSKPNFKIAADGVVLMDSKTGKIIYSKNPDKPYPPASTTKIMTALLTLERGNLDDVVTIGHNPPLADGSKIYIFEGEKIKVRDLLYGLLLASANDCAEALAEYLSGSLDNFAKDMNKRAKELGCTNTNFVNPSGLYNNKHRTSARDLALIMNELVKQPEYTKIATTVSYNIPSTNKSKEKRPLWNENRLIQKNSNLYYKGCEGGKTGYTVQSDHSYVASVNKDNHRLIVALIHDKEKHFFDDAVKLFNYGFSNFTLNLLYPKDSYVTTYTNDNLKIPLYASEDFYYLKSKDDSTNPDLKLENTSLKNLKFKKGDVVLSANLSRGSNSVGSLTLKSGVDHESTLFNNKFININLTTKNIILICLAVLCTIFLIFKITKKVSKCKKNNKYYL